MNKMILCTDAEITNLQFFDFGIAPELLLYSYIPIALISLLFAVFISFTKQSTSNSSRNLFVLLSITFTIHVSNELAQWVIVPAGLMLFGWGLSLLLHALITFLLFYFVITFTYSKFPSFSFNLVSFLLLLPIVIFLPTTLATEGFDPDWCGAIDGPLWTYMYLLEVLAISAFLILTLRSTLYFFRTRDTEYKKQFFLFVGAFLFSVIFFGSEFFGSFTHLYEINFVGPVGMLIFLGSVTFIIVKYRVFNAKLIGAQALMLIICALVGSLLFLEKALIPQFIAGITFFFSLITGYFLIRSVKKEIRQREELEVVTKQLEGANVRLKELDKQKSEFVSIASHQLRSPLTAIRGYASMLAEGSFGQMPAKAQESAKRIEESAKLMAMSIEDYLNVSRIESGNMKYNLSDFNLRDMVENICDDLRAEALKKGLILLFRSNVDSKGIVNADVGKTTQIIHNLINNSLKYTPKGSVNVFVKDDIKKKRISIAITDTGIGMSKETAAKLFHKFTRADNANSVNVSGTGLGLFVALKMAEAMGGTITADSEGDGKGSTFTIELPLAM